MKTLRAATRRRMAGARTRAGVALSDRLPWAMVTASGKKPTMGVTTYYGSTSVLSG